MKQTEDAGLKMRFTEFLEEAHGFYGNMLLRLSKTFGLDSAGVLDHAPANKPHTLKGAAADITGMAIQTMFHCEC